MTKQFTRTILTSTITAVAVEKDGKTEKHLAPIVVQDEVNKAKALKVVREKNPDEKEIKIKKIEMSETQYSMTVDAFIAAATKGESTPAGTMTF